MRFSINPLAKMCLSLETLISMGNSDHVVVSVSIDFLSYSKRDAQFQRIAYDHFCADWNGLRGHLGDVPCRHFSKHFSTTGKR